MNPAIAKLPDPSQANGHTPVINTFVNRLTHGLTGTQDTDAIVSQVMDDVMVRASEGQKKYGVFLAPHNGRNPLVDLYQEVLDANLYLEQYVAENAATMPQAERADMSVLATQLLTMTFVVRHYLNEQLKEVN